MISMLKSEKIVPVLLLVTVAMAFGLGYLFKEMSDLKKGTATLATTTAANAGATQPNVTLDTIKGLFSKDLIKIGDANRKVLFVEIADPSCPYCHIAGGYDSELAGVVGSQFKYVSDGGNYDPPVTEMKKLVDSGKASFIWIYYPGHSGGEMAAKALYCANDMGKFWEVDKLLGSEKGYEIENGVNAQNVATSGPIVGNDKTKSAALADFLKSVIDPTAMRTCLDSGKYDSRIQSDQAVATSLGVQGTPGFFVNTAVFTGAYSYTDMKSAVDAALK
jgi:protein-disulfide isomerase